MWIQRKGPVKVGELTKPMVDVISQVTANCLDPGGNINKESRPVQSIKRTWNSAIHSLSTNQILVITEITDNP